MSKTRTPSFHHTDLYSTPSLYVHNKTYDHICRLERGGCGKAFTDKSYNTVKCVGCRKKRAC